MAFSLDDITCGKDPKPPLCIVYGVGGVGKSTWASGAKNSIFIQTEEGLNTINCAKFPKCTKYDEVFEQITLLFNEQHNFENLVIDSIDWFEKLIHEEVRETHGDKIFADYGKGYTFAVPLFSELLNALTALRDSRNMGIYLIGHSTIKRFDAPDTAGYDRYSLDLHEKVGSLAFEWADVVLFANYKVFVTKEDAGFGKEKGKAIGKGDRVLYTEERPAWKAKNRYNLPAELPLDYGAFYDAMVAGLSDEEPEEKSVVEEKKSRRKAA